MNTAETSALPSAPVLHPSVAGTLLWADGRLGDDRDPIWTLVAAEEPMPITASPTALQKSPSPEPASTARPSGQLLPMQTWLGLDARARHGQGIWLAPTDDPAALAGLLQDVALVAIAFPNFRDGRGYSIAALLRSRYGFANDLRAVGEVLIDQLFYLKRVGFTSFVLRADQRMESAVAALHTFTETYQRAADTALPLYRRRAVSGW